MERGMEGEGGRGGRERKRRCNDSYSFPPTSPVSSLLSVAVSSPPASPPAVEHAAPTGRTGSQSAAGNGSERTAAHWMGKDRGVVMCILRRLVDSTDCLGQPVNFLRSKKKCLGQ